MPVRHLAATFLCVGIGLGCASGTGSSRDAGLRGSAGGAATGFPPAADLEELLEEPPPSDAALATRYRDVDAWELSGPFPDLVGATPRSAEDAVDALVDEFVARRAGLVIATESLDCFARELGRFLAAEQGLPGVALQRFAAGRCGVATAMPSFGAYSWTGGPPVADEADAVAKLRGEIEQQLRKHVVGGPLELGVWLGARGDRVDLLLAMGERHVRLDPVSSVPGPDGSIELTGELLRPAATLGAAATRGRFEWSECTSAEGVEPPRFQLRCPVAPDDASAWISLEYLPPERLLGSVALTLLARPRDGDERHFRRDSYAPARSVSDAAELPAAFLELLNGVRADASLPPLALDRAQTDTATRVAPYYFAALLGESPDSVAELVALGMLAGWNVDGIVQNGQFTWAWQVESLDASRLLSDALQYPGARSALLSREAERIAVGPVLEPSSGERSAYLALIASSYTLFPESAHRRDAEHVHGLLAKARAAEGRSAPGELEAARPLTVSAAARVQAGDDPGDVLHDLIQSGAELLRGRRVVGWMAETQDLDTLVFPNDFVSQPKLDLAVAVPVHKPKGEAWGRYVVLLLAAEPPDRSL